MGKKRKTPGINGSSSAGIAFMLLIFFLITTSMDIDIKQLREKVRNFIENPYNDEHMPEKTEVDVPFFGKQMVTKNHVISLQNDRGTEYQAYIDVQNELAAAYNELRDEVSRKKFGKAFADLDEDQQKAVQMIYPQKISEAEPKNYGGK